MTPNEVYDDSQIETNDVVHQQDKLDQSNIGTCTLERLTWSQFVLEFSANAADADVMLLYLDVEQIILAVAFITY